MGTRTETINICDRCKKESKDRLHSVDVKVNILSKDGNYPDLFFKWSDLCTPCRDAGVEYFREALL